MAKLLTGNDLNFAIENLFLKATEEIIIISPYIKLHKRIKDILRKRQKDNIKIIIVFGKNYEDKTKSLSIADLSFFKKFIDVEVRYEERLHAKFYANEKTSIITSMNLYDFSMENNIEFGVLSHRSSFLKGMVNALSDSKSLDEQASYHVLNVIENAELIYNKQAIFERKFLKKQYVKSKVKVNKVKEYLVPTELYQKKEKKGKSGYCIRTGKEIPFNLDRPFTLEAYKSWTQYKNPTYPEKFCHKTGKASYGKTSMKNPVLKK